MNAQYGQRNGNGIGTGIEGGIEWGRLSLAAVSALLLLILLPEAGAAQALPPVNLGFTSFLDGGPPAGPGLYFQQYVQYFSSNEFKDSDGDEFVVEVPGPGGDDLRLKLLDDLDLWVSLSQLIYQSDQPILCGGKWGIDVIVPIISIDVEPGDLGVLSDNGVGLGDVLIGPYIQWDPIMGENGPIFMHRIELQNLLPTGEYDSNRVLNAGSRFYSFNPYWAGTLFLHPRVKTSWRFHYLWNAKNDRPNETLFPGADDVQAGQAIHLNFSSSFELVPKRLHAGLNGYYLKQITDSEVDGNNVDGSREQVLGLGPGAVWHFSPDDHLFANLYFETEAENRPEGVRLNLRWTHHF
jgi:anthranilate 1,2-dioxygenase (deaminating, decarboxylating) large subunit